MDIDLVIDQMSVAGPETEMKELLSIVLEPRQEGEASRLGLLAVADPEAEIVVLSVKKTSRQGHALIITLLQKHDAGGAQT